MTIIVDYQLPKQKGKYLEKFACNRGSGQAGHKPGPKVIKCFSCSTQLSMKFQLLVNVEIVKISGKFRFKTKKNGNLSCS